MDPGLIRALCLFTPVLLTTAFWGLRRPDSRQTAAAILACCWNFPALLLVHAIAIANGWWHYGARGGLLLGMPVDLYFGWAVFWGAFPALAFPRLRLAALAPIALAVDLVYMPLLGPVLRLGPNWLAGEVLSIAVCLIPAQLLARWTADDKRLAARACLQLACFSGFLLGVIPAAILDATGGSWHAASALGLQVLALPSILGLTALQEFVMRGSGTPVPLDPPKRLVTTGVYSYVGNPMQIAGCLLLFGWGVLLDSPWLCIAGLTAGIYSAGFAASDEREDLRARFGVAWHEYASVVRPWRFRWRPWRTSTARLYVAASCPLCSQIGNWIARRAPVGLEIRPAEERILRRITYDPGDGTPEEEGVAAFARALEHIHFGWAIAGFTMRLPIVRQLIQITVDASGGAPQPQT